MPWELIGVTDPAGGALEVHGQFRIGLDELRAAHTETLPRLFGGSAAAQVREPAAGVRRRGRAPSAGRRSRRPSRVDAAAAAAEPIADPGDRPAGDPGAVRADRTPDAVRRGSSESDAGPARPSPDQR